MVSEIFQRKMLNPPHHILVSKFNGAKKYQNTIFYVETKKTEKGKTDRNWKVVLNIYGGKSLGNVSL